MTRIPAPEPRYCSYCDDQRLCGLRCPDCGNLTKPTDAIAVDAALGSAIMGAVRAEFEEGTHA